MVALIRKKKCSVCGKESWKNYHVSDYFFIFPRSINILISNRQIVDEFTQNHRILCSNHVKTEMLVTKMKGGQVRFRYQTLFQSFFNRTSSVPSFVILVLLAIPFLIEIIIQPYISNHYESVFYEKMST
jgi:L-ribulose-5-phosphate 3-epimerase UlaE